MNGRAAWLAAAGLWAAVGASAAAAADVTVAEWTTETVLRQYLDVWTTGEVDRLEELVTEDFKRHGAYGPADSREQLRRVIENSQGFYRDFRIEVLGLVANAEKGAARWRSTGGWRDTDFKLDSINFAMVHFRDGKISEEWVLGNNMDLFRTFGYRLSPPMATIVPPPIDQPPGPGLAQRMAPKAAELAAYAAKTVSVAPKNAGELEIRSPIACRLFLGGREIGWLEPGGSVVLRLARGDHGVRAASLGGSVFFDRDVVVRKEQATAVEIEAPGRVIMQPRTRATEDLATGLMWQMTDNGKNATLPAAEAYCRDLRQGGYTDWRLPTIHELEGIHAPDADKRYRTIVGIQLSDCCPWSSTPRGEHTWTYAFNMDMRYLQYKALGFHMRALCVRDAAAN